MSAETATSGRASAAARTPAVPAVPAVECRRLTVGYDGSCVLRDLDLVVGAGETLALLGPSGSGKTTLLHTIAGFLSPTAGEVLLGGRPVASTHHCVPADKRGVAMVFQNYALWPHLNALDNVAYPLRRAGLRRAAARAAAATLLDALGAAQLADRRPAQLSGGQQQRVGVARALARQGVVTLLDEPTAHLDQALRAQVQDEIARVIHPAGGAVIYATHDAAEALAIADRVAVLRSGRLLQVGTPREIYETPCDLWAARLTGPASAIRGRVATGAGTVTVAGDAGAGGPWLLVRPEWTALGGAADGRVCGVHYRGAYTDYTIDTTAGRVIVRDDGPPRLSAGDDMTWSVRKGWPLPTTADADGS